ncbi:MAG: hypothetical protein AAFO29_13970, partial [Actinomycetota bacterium]
QGTLSNIETGQSLNIALPTDGSAFTLPAISPDGRWLAEVDVAAQAVVFRDLDSDEIRQVPFEEAVEPPVFFLERGTD